MKDPADVSQEEQAYWEGRVEEANRSWQPIKTAPKDGTEILACNMNQGGVMRLIYWYRTLEQWREKGNVIICLQATHWMPLPFKPTAQPDRKDA